MNDQEKQQNLTPAESNTPVEQSNSKKQKSARNPRSNILIWAVAAIYLVYLSVEMVKGLTSGDVPSGTTMFYVSIVCSILFVGTAVYLLLQILRSYTQSFKASLDKVEDSDDSDDTDAEEAADSTTGADINDAGDTSETE